MSLRVSRIAAFAVLVSPVLAGAGTAADTPPALDVTATCAAVARGALSLGRNRESCLSDERAARDQLARSWSKYGAADKAHCIANVSTGGPASYVELVSCLDVMRDGRDSATGIAEEPVAPARPSRSR